MVSTEAPDSIADSSSSAPASLAADSSAKDASSASKGSKSTESEQGPMPSFSELRTALEEVDEGIDSALTNAASSVWNFASLVGASVSASIGRGGALEGLGKGLERSLGGPWRGMERLGKGVGGIMDSIDHWVEEGVTQKTNEEPVVVPRVHLRRFQERLEELRGNVQTFLEPVEDQGFQEWVKEFSVDDMEQECTEILNEHELVAGFYERAVPRVVQEDIFWGRYFWRKNRLEEEEKRRMKLLEGAEDEASESLQGWGDDWDTDDEDGEHHQTPVGEQINERSSVSKEQKLDAPDEDCSVRTENCKDKPLQESREHGTKPKDSCVRGDKEASESRSKKGSEVEAKKVESSWESLKEERPELEGTKPIDRQVNDEFADDDWDDDWE